MSKTAYVLGVDDEKINREILYDLFEDMNPSYEIKCVGNGTECIEQVVERTPDLILLDVNMPGMNGLETCKKLRQMEACLDIPIIFVSALASNNERLKGYEVGGDDYVTKPFNGAELMTKVKLSIQTAAKRKVLEEEQANTMIMANIAMDSSFELGSVLNFIKRSFKCKTHLDLAESVFKFLKNFGLEGSLMLKVRDSNEIYFHDELVRPLEKHLLEKVQHHGERIFEYKNRLVFNSYNAVLLIRNMTFSEEMLGRYRDHFAILIEGIDARANALNDEVALREKQNAIIEVIDLTRKGLTGIDEKHQKQRTKNAKIISETIMSVEDAFIHLGLDEKQETFLLELVRNMEKETDALYAGGLDLDEQFDDLMDHLKEVVQ